MIDISKINNLLNENNMVEICSVPDGADAMIINQYINENKKEKNFIFITSDGMAMEKAIEFLSYMNKDIDVLAFPAWDTVPYDRVSPNANIIAKRVSTLSEIAYNPTPKKQRIIVTSVSAILQKLPPKKIFLNANFEITVGKELDFDKFLHFASINGYHRVEQVMEPGEYAVRGGIIDIYPNNLSNPLRIDMYGDEIETIKTFDPVSQRTHEKIKSYNFEAMSEVALDENTIKTFRAKYREEFGFTANKDEIYEAISNKQRYMGIENWLPLFYSEKLPSLFDYLPNANVFIGKNVEIAVKSKSENIIDYYKARLIALEGKTLLDEVDTYRPVKPEEFYLSEDEFANVLKQRQEIYFNDLDTFVSEGFSNYSADILPSRDFSSAKSISNEKIYSDLKEYFENIKTKKVIACYSEGSREKLFNLLSAHEIKNLAIADNWEELKEVSNSKIVLIILNIPTGFRAKEIAVVTEQEILGDRVHRKHKKKISNKDLISDISSLSIGEFVVHRDHGIGQFDGLINISAGNAPHDCLRIIYDGGDKLFVPVENIDVITRYGNEDTVVKLDKLGGVAWQARKSKVKKRIKDIADKLIKIAAARKLKKADIFNIDASYDEFCSRFPFNETEDQDNAIADVVSDLSAGIPMDRLICGDVGFGKTEVALRAAYIAANSGVQVAIVAPTTLLVRQHYYNFKKRFEGFPVRIRMLSRLVSAKDAKTIKEEMADGAVEIVIGTHALLAKNIKFANLGLLIIDEEQHFGVSHKEKLKELKSDIHVLTLTATPIPRTLQLSMTGVKQLSLISTPPVDRLAARTFVMPYDSVMIKEAIYREKFRNGQIFYVCPRVSQIAEVREKLGELVPDIRVAVAHGQMPASQLEDIITAFANKEYDLLLSTTIIESGIDMPTVNTMIIHRADMFGLSQLYQLRGRIGRGKSRGYAYLTVPSRKKINEVAKRRLDILKALDSLGAGFSIASHDMDIRGAGNLLGEEQSGHVKEVGIALYQHMLEEAIAQIKAGDGEFNDEYEQDWSPQITSGIPIIIPEAYISDLGVRLGLYKRIGELKSFDEAEDMRSELIDRFGKLPTEVENLLQVVVVKSLCKKANIEKVDVGSKGVVISLKNNIFPNPDKLIEFISMQIGMVRVRSDHKIVLERHMETYEERLKGLTYFCKELAKLAS